MGHPRLVATDHTASWPAALQRAASGATLANAGAEPVVIRMHQSGSQKQLEDLASSSVITLVVDNYDDQLAELFLSRNAQLYRANAEVKRSSIEAMLQEHYDGRPSWQLGSWVYYPWSGQLVHVLDETEFFELKTIRNRNLITADEQRRYAAFRVGVLGLSVGSSVASALILQGGSRQLKIADGAVISGSNLNRIRTGVASVGEDKSVIAARELYQMDPYLQLRRLPTSVTANALPEFFDESWALQAVVDEMDELEMKVRLRLAARERRVPVIMVTDLGDDAMLDVERYDLEPKLPLFHGLAPGIEEAVLNKATLTPRQWLKFATGIIGTKNVPLRMQQSLLEIGTKLPTQPQLGGTAMMGGAVAAFAIRQLATGGALKSGRHIVSLEQAFLSDRGLGHQVRHRRHTKALDQAMDAM
jgi:hypothetical protein